MPCKLCSVSISFDVIVLLNIISCCIEILLKYTPTYLPTTRSNKYSGAVARNDQPAQIDFENSIIIECLKHRHSSSKLPVFMEDEGNRIGSRSLPTSMRGPMANDFPLILLETPLQDRIDICIQEYVQSPFLAFLADARERDCNANDKGSNFNDKKEEAHARIRDLSLDAVGRINKGLQKRWGGTLNQGYDIIGEFGKAFDLFKSSNASNVSGFRKPVQLLLEDYYDPMYDYQMSKRKGKVLFRGGIDEIVIWARDYTVVEGLKSVT